MGTKTFNNYEDILTFTRASGGHALRPVSYGDELVTNGTFDTDTTGWADDGGANPTASVSSGQLVLTATQAGSIIVEQSSAQFEAGKIYQIKVDVVTTTDNISVWNKASSSINISALSTGTNVINYFATESGYLRIGNLGAVFSTGEGFTLDNISLKEVTFDQSGGRLTLFEHPNNVPRVEYVISDNKARFANIDNHLLSASIGVEPQSTEFDVLVGGRKIGDITNNGDVSAFDASQYLGWFDGTLTNQTYIDYIEGTLNPYIEENLEKYVLPYPAGINRLGLLVEESRTNLFTYSLPDSSNWASSSGTISANQATAPDGTNTAINFVAEADSSASYFNLDGSITSGTTYTQSIFAKAKDTSWIQIAPSTGFDSAYQNFNLQTGALGSSDNVTSASITDVGNGWYRCSVTVTATSTSAGGRMVFVWMSGDGIRLDSDSGFVPDGTQGVYFWGAQLEASSFPTSYIKTTGSTATRSADVASIPVADFGFNQSAGSVVVDFNSAGSESDYPHAFSLDGSTVNDAIRMGLNTTNLKQFVVRVAGVNQCVLNNGTYSPNDDLKISVAYKENDFSSSDNGDAVVTDTSGTLPSVQTLSIGKWQNASQTNGHIKSIKYYPRRLTNAQLEELSS